MSICELQLINKHRHITRAACASAKLFLFIFHRCRFLRNRDREINKDSYPSLTYPEVYILHGGYSNFFNSQLVSYRIFIRSFVRYTLLCGEQSVSLAVQQLIELLLAFRLDHTSTRFTIWPRNLFNSHFSEYDIMCRVAYCAFNVLLVVYCIYRYEVGNWYWW